MSHHHVTATFDSQTAAQNAVTQLVDAGFTQDHISILASESARPSFTIKDGNKSEEYTGTGATAGGALGAITALLMSAAIIPTGGLSLVAIGPIFATLAGLGAGSFAGGVVGALVGAGVPEHEAKLYENSMKEGHILLGVTTESKDEHKRAEEILKECDSLKVAA